MRRREFLGREVSVIAMGTVPVGTALDEAQSFDLLDAYAALGGSFIDLARGYGNGAAERTVGKWLRRRSFCGLVATKGGLPGPDGAPRLDRASLESDLNASLEALGAEKIELYWLHRDDPARPVEDMLDTLNRFVQDGRIVHFGASNWTYERFRQAQEYAEKRGLVPFSVSSPHFSLARQQADPYGGGCVSLTGDENADARRWYTETQTPVFAYSSLGRGLLSGKLKSSDAKNAGRVLDSFAMKGYGCADNYQRLARCEELAAQKGCSVAQIAMAWVYSQPMNTFAIATMSSPARIQENIAALNLKLTEDECRYLNLETGN